MIKHIGIVACSAEGAALCYRTICMESAQFLGEHKHPEITMHSYALSDYIPPLEKGDWPQIAQLMISSAHKVTQTGAQFAICPDNTIHQAFDLVIAQSPIPWLHIADVVAQAAKTEGFKRIGILGTQYLMEGPVYPEVFNRYNLTTIIPELNDRQEINRIIFKELVQGIFLDSSRIYFETVIDQLKADGCDAVVLGCTEIPLIVQPARSPLPTLDSTRLLARAAIKEAIRD